MRAFLKSIWGRITVIALAVVLLVGIGLGIWWYLTPKFRDVTVELGFAMPELGSFLTENAVPEWASFVTDTGDLDLSKAGSRELELEHLGRREKVQLIIEDTVAPVAVFRDVLVTVDDEITADMFVESCEDLAPVTIAFQDGLEARQGYDDQTVTVLVTDESGNRVSGTCTISYAWLKESFTVELGTPITVQDILLNPETGAKLVDPAIVEELNTAPPGEYTISSVDGGKTCVCKVIIRDTVAPQLEAKGLLAEQGTDLTIEDFLVAVSDVSNDVKITLEGDISCQKAGSYPVVIEAVDPSGNKTRVEVVLEVVYDITSPVFSGMAAMTIPKNFEADYSAGVTAYDEKDGEVKFTVDTSRVDITQAGTYYVIYTAVDRSGNQATYRRAVVVAHDNEDTDKLVAEHAALSGTSIESIRYYVRSYIFYNSNWGGDDPVWYGFTTRSGNCYVHALCLQRLLAYHGYQSQLIWVEDHSHYWLIINTGDGWKHIDATPSELHGKYLFMNDAQRLETLSGRKWDTSLWPACE